MLTYLTNNYNKANTHFCHTTERAFLYDYKQIHIRSEKSKLAVNWRYKLLQNRTLLSNIQLSKIKILSNQWLFFCRLTTPINYTNLCAVDWTKRVLLCWRKSATINIKVLFDVGRLKMDLSPDTLNYFCDTL